MSLITGIPTDPDVRRLIERFGKPAEGTEYSHEQISAIIESEPGSARYRSVTGAWRKRMMRDHNVLLLAMPGEGFKAATPTERVDSGERQVSRGTRAIKRGYTVVGSTDLTRLDAVDRRKAEHLLHVSRALLEHQRAEAKKWRPELPAPITTEPTP